MKTPVRSLFLSLAFAGLTALTLPVGAQEAAPPPPEATKPAADDTAPAPAPSGELRRLDVAPPAPPAVEKSEAADAIAEKESEPAAEEAASTATETSRPVRRTRVEQRVTFLSNSTLASDEEASEVVSVLGSSTSMGKVENAVVSILGSSTSSGSVGDAVVSVLGSSRATGGRVGGPVVSVLGNTYVDTEVSEAIAVMGNVELGPNAIVHNEVVCVGGVVKREPAAQVHGQINNISFGIDFGGFEWLHTWVTRCLLLGRPLAFGPHLAWAWWIALTFLGLYLVLALLFPRGVEKCAATLEQSPGYSLLTALLVTLLTPLAAVVLAITLIGTPALVIALFVAGLFGKAVMLAWIGRRITSPLMGGKPIVPVLAVLIGGVVVLLLYTIPIVGFAVAKFTSWLGLGVVVYTLIAMNRRPKAAPAIVTPPPATVSAVPLSSEPASAGVVVPPMISGEVPSAASASATPPPVMTAPTVVISAATLPRAGFWIRVAASLLDVLLVGMAVKLMPHFWQPNFLLLFATYCCVLWGLKGTTVGGIVCGLKIVRLDDRRVDWPTAIVRTLGGFLSFVTAGLGFIWVAFDDQKQSWHDKIAGTTIVQVPRGVSLV
ncbi:MAG TPA: RDD family protein [Opitutus sp.]|nr:RDD family protein [Opitutus sp.]